MPHTDPAAESRPSCLFAKVYLSAELVDRFLVDVVHPVVAELVGAGPDQFLYFFFIRYADAMGFHLRLRFFGSRSAVTGEPRKRLLSALRLAVPGLPVANLVLDRYRPEWNRYAGRSGLSVSERLFAASSLAVLDFLKLKLRGATKVSRVEFALVSGEALLDAVGFGPKQRQALFAAGRGGDAPLSAPSEDRPDPAKDLTAALLPILQASFQDPTAYWRGREVRLQASARQMDEEIRRRFGAPVAPALRATLPRLAPSYLHVHYNRIGIMPREEKVLLNARSRFAL